MKVFTSSALKAHYQPILQRLQGFGDLCECHIAAPQIAIDCRANERTINLLGEDIFNYLSNKCVVVAGLGGVGAACFSALARSGLAVVGIDADDYDYSNQNRQLHSEFYAQPKAGVIAQLYGAVCLQTRLQSGNIAQVLDALQPCVFVDAIDDVAAKSELAIECARRKIGFVASGGAARRLDASRVQIARYDRVRGCALSKAVRARLKAAKYNKRHWVVFSDEQPAGAGLGSLMMVTSTFGMQLASLCIKELLAKR